jgi:hypothetical protein
MDRESFRDAKGRGTTIVDKHVETRVLGERGQQVRERPTHSPDWALLERAAVDRYTKHCAASRVCVDQARR